MTITVRPRTHLLKLIERREVADRTLAIWLQKPADFDFTAGQFAELSILNPDSASEPFILHEDATRAAVFLAGGIGITPVRSILVHAAKAKLPNQLVLFYSNRKPEDAAFLDELRDLQSLNYCHLTSLELSIFFNDSGSGT